MNPEYAEQVRAACELLYEIAARQAQHGKHPAAPYAVDWLNHVGAVAAGLAQWQAQRTAPDLRTLPTVGGMQ